MESEKELLELADSAEKIWPYYIQCLKSEETLAELRKQIEETEKQFGESKTTYKSVKSSLENFMKTYDNDKDALILKKSAIEKAKEHNEKAEALTKEREALILVYKKLKTDNDSQNQLIDATEKGFLESEKKN